MAYNYQGNAMPWPDQASYGTAVINPPVYNYGGYGGQLGNSCGAGYGGGGYGGEMLGSVRGAPDAGVKTAFMRGRRKRMNILAVLLCLFVPWIVFSIVYAVMSFSWHYQQPWLCYTIVAGAFLVVVGTLGFASFSMKKKRAGDPNREPTWAIFLAITTFVAWGAGVVAGDCNFYKNLQPFYDIMNLNMYPSVDPSRMRGQQLMDAGRIMFTEGTQLDLGRSIGFRNMDLYCVAPIAKTEFVSTASGGPVNGTNLDTYDFWAVGTNCCSGNAADFHCGEFNNPRARGGLRLMRDDQRAFYRLAVQQAEAAYGIKASHPLFFIWMQDPMHEVGAYQDNGLKYYMLGMFSHFSFQLFLVISASLAFSRLGDL